MLAPLDEFSRHLAFVRVFRIRFEDGEALYAAVCACGLEGVVAKRGCDPYRPGERGWVKTKNRATARFAEERTASAAPAAR